MKWLFSIVLLSLSSLTLAQGTGYMDADNYGEAIGLFEFQLLTTDNYMEECSSRFPALVAEMQRNRDVWRTKDKQVHDIVRLIVAKRNKAHPEVSQQMAAMSKENVTRIFANFDSLSNQAPQQVKVVAQQACQKHFEERASGVWRMRIPKAYDFVEAH